jgi:hypothetical protein
MLESHPSQRFLLMISQLTPPGVGYYTPNQASIYAAATNRQAAMIAQEGRQVTLAEAHSSLGHDGILAAVTNRQTAMIAQEGRPVTLAKAHSDLSSYGGQRRMATQGLPSERRGGRINSTMAEMSALARAARTIVDGREKCINGCDRLPISASILECSHCISEKNKRKREDDEKSEAKGCVGCGEEEGICNSKFIFLLSFTPLLLSTYCAASRLVDNWHHPSDILAGMVIGLVCAIVSYHSWYPPVTSYHSGIPLSILVPLSYNNNMTPTEEEGSLPLVNVIEGHFGGARS